MADPGKMMNFISETEVEENKKTRGERVEDGTIAPDRPLYEVLQEQKEKKEAEQREKFRNLPPKALDEEELEFLQTIQQHQKEREQETAEAERDALTQFQTAVLERTIRVDDSAHAPSPLPPAGGNVGAHSGAKRRSEGTAEAHPAQRARGSAPKVGVIVQPKRARGQPQLRGEGKGPGQPAVSSGAADSQGSTRDSTKPLGGRCADAKGPGRDADGTSPVDARSLLVPGAKSGDPGQVAAAGVKSTQGSALEGLAAYADSDDDDDEPRT